MNAPQINGVGRRTFFKVAAASVGAAIGLDRLAGLVQAEDLRPDDPRFRWDEYEKIVNRQVVFRQLYEWPNLTNPTIFSNLANGINGFQFSYAVPANLIQVVVQTFYTANAAMYDDTIWDKYKMGEALKINDPTTNQPATRNIYYASKIPAADVATAPTDRNSPYYSDTSLEGLQRRGVLFLT